jgi:hypothetical protein
MRCMVLSAVWQGHNSVGCTTSHAGWDAADEVASASTVQRVTTAMWALTVPAGLVGALASWLRARYLTHTVLPKFA